MKKIFTVITLSCSLFTQAQVKLSNDQLQVQKTLTDLFQAIADRDTAMLKNSCTSDIMLLENGQLWNLDTLVQKVLQGRGKDFKRVNTLDFIETMVNGNFAWVSYNNQAEIIRNEQHLTFIKWLETTILIKEGNGWKVRVLHSTLLK